MLQNEASTDGGNESPIHVLEISGNAIVGGVEKYVYNLAQYLPTQGFKITCVTPYHSAYTSSLRQLGSDVYVTIMDNDPYWRSIQFVTELVRHLKIDLIHAHMARAHVLAGIVGRLTGVPVVATVHGMEITNQELAIARTTGTSLTVVCQQAFTEALALGLPPERVTLIPNGVDLKTYTPNRTGSGFRKAMHFSIDDLVVGFMGRLAWEKGPDTFVDIAGKVHKERPEVKFVMVGEGPMEDELRQQIHAAGLDQVVHLAGLWTNTWEVYPAFDLLLQTSRIEGMPFALLEAMACGRPIAAFGIGGIGEMVEVGTTGILGAASDWNGLADGVSKLLACPEHMRQMGQAARKRVEEFFDLQDSINAMAGVFRRQLGKASKEEMIHSKWPVSKSEREAVPVDSAIFEKRK